MSGKKDFNSASAREMDQKVQQKLAEYENNLGIKEKNPNIPAEKYLLMPEEEIAIMTPEQCGEAAIILAQYAFYLQRAFNIEIGRVNWCNAQIDRIISPKMKNYNGNSASERRMMAIIDNDFAISCEKIRSEAQSRADRLNYLSTKIDSLSYRFADLQQTKKVKHE